MIKVKKSIIILISILLISLLSLSCLASVDTVNLPQLKPALFDNGVTVTQFSLLKEKSIVNSEDIWATKARSLVYCDKEDGLFTGSEPILNCDSSQSVDLDVYIGGESFIIMTETPQIYSIMEVKAVAESDGDVWIFLCESDEGGKCLVYLIPNDKSTFIIGVEWSNIIYYYLCDLDD